MGRFGWKCRGIFTGESGTGKTSLAKKIATERGLAYFISSGSNDVMDGYGQQPCLIPDDVRPSCLGLPDLLKLLDSHTATSIKSRYKNQYLNCDLIILTSVLDLDTFYNNVFEREREPITQLKRRCGAYVQMFLGDIKTVQENRGYATAAFTLDVYGHVTEKMKQESAARMQQFIQAVKPPIRETKSVR